MVFIKTEVGNYETVFTMASNNAVYTPTMAWKIDRPCPICFEDFNDGDLAVVLGCRGAHVLCNDCHSALQKYGEVYPSETIAAVTASHPGAPNYNLFQDSNGVLRQEIITSGDDGDDKCPECRDWSSVATLVVAKKYYTGKAE